MLTFSQYLAREIVRGTSKKFSGLQSAYSNYKKENENMSTGTLNDSNKIGAPADGFNSKRDLTNAGSQEPNAVTGQSGADSTSPVTSGLTAASQVSLGAVKNVDSRPLVGSHADATLKAVPVSTDN